jgi:hypothetical protein
MTYIHGLPETYNDVESRFYKQKKDLSWAW